MSSALHAMPEALTDMLAVVPVVMLTGRLAVVLVELQATVLGEAPHRKLDAKLAVATGSSSDKET